MKPNNQKPKNVYGIPQNCTKCKNEVIDIIRIGINKGKLYCYNCGHIYKVKKGEL